MKLTRTRQPASWIGNFVPFMDVVFLLLIFFALSSTFVLQPGISVTPPVSSFTLGPVSKPQVVSIVSSPVTRIFHRNEQIGLIELERRLAQRDGDSQSVIIKADRATSYETVMQVANICILNDYSVILATTPEEDM